MTVLVDLVFLITQTTMPVSLELTVVRGELVGIAGADV
jgi:hypothetical protein